jgi:phage repressor protein C with HTH and peptisase S24 domain
MNLLSERLRKAIAEEAQRRGEPIKNADLARAAKTSQTSVGYWLTDSNGIGAAKARLLGAYLNVNPLWLETGQGEMHVQDEAIANSGGKRGPAFAADAFAPSKKRFRLTPAYGERRISDRAQPFVHSTVVAYDSEDGTPDDVVLVPESRIEFAGGDGKINYELVEDEEPATYRRSWFQKHGINPDRARRFRVAGDSMEPLLFARDTILVNLDETQVIDGRLYALRYGDQLRVKYLSKRLDGTLVLRSVNPAYKDEEVSSDLANEHITVIGRVRDRSGTGGL